MGYQLLRVAGKGQGLDGTQKEMGKRFAENGPRGVAEEEEPDNGREAVGG